MCICGTHVGWLLPQLRRSSEKFSLELWQYNDLQQDTLFNKQFVVEKNNQFFFEDNVDKVANYKNFFWPIYFSCVRCFSLDKEVTNKNVG